MHAGSTPILEVRDLVKVYPEVRAVDGISFAIAAGTCFGLLGPNGAGKTTTVEMIEGVTTPTSGEIFFRGAERGRGFQEQIGIQFQQTALQDYLTVKDVLKLFADLYARSLPIEEVAELCALEEFLDRYATKISGGQRQRLLVGLALINDPALLFLDEPTTGLDPQARHNFWELVRGVQARGKTIVLTTHYMEEAYELCDEIAIMDRGRIIAQGEPKQLLKEQFEGSVVELPREDFTPGAGFPWTFYEKNGLLEIQTTDVNATLEHLLEAGVSLHHLEVHSRTLEDLFLALTGHQLRT
jgi:ABC-2 type transport system ATP-binding protein